MGGTDYTNSIRKSVTDGQTDGRTGANLNAPDYRHQGIMKKKNDDFFLPEFRPHLKT